MTKEPIMINDVDVSGCECYNPNIKMDCILYPLQPDACKNNPNCHYKLYKRKEQECEEFKQALQEIKKIAEETSKIYPTKTLNLILQKCEVLNEKV